MIFYRSRTNKPRSSSGQLTYDDGFESLHATSSSDNNDEIRIVTKRVCVGEQNSINSSEEKKNAAHTTNFSDIAHSFYRSRRKSEPNLSNRNDSESLVSS